MTRTKEDITETLSHVLGISKSDMHLAVDGVFAVIESYLAQGDRIEIRGLGVLEVVERAPKIAQDIYRGEAVYLAATKTIKFKPSRLLLGVIRECATSPV